MNTANMMMLSLTTTFILILISKILNEKKMETKESSSTFECGFDSQSQKNNNISSQFFMIALLFIVFDMEISLLIPLLNNMKINLQANWVFITLISLLLISTLLEWKKGFIEWTK